MVYLEWVDMPGGDRFAIDGPFDFVQLTYDTIRAQNAGDTDGDIVIGERADGGGWFRHNDDSEGGEDGLPGWYSDLVINTGD